jgi:Protein of unknown function (DUF3179)
MVTAEQRHVEHEHPSPRRRPRIVPPQGFEFQHGKPEGLAPHLAPLEQPRWVPATDAAHMRDDDPVLVVALSQQSYVLPWWVMKNHHVANLTLERSPVTVTLCERCSSAAAFDGRVEGETRTFQVVGIFKGTHALADHETESLWTSFSGECIFGFHHGYRLRQLPLLQTRWRDCADLQPAALVVDGAGESREGHGSDRFPGSFEKPLGYGPPMELDPRLPPNDLVLGVAIDGAARAYRLDSLVEAGGVLNDRVGGTEIVVLAGPSSYTGIAFGRRVGDQVLRFDRRGNAVVDAETGSTWDITGLALAGPLEGRRLGFVTSRVEEWYSWAAYNPQTDIAAT